MDELKTRTLGPKSGAGAAVAAVAELAIEANRAREGASFMIDYSALPRVLSLYAFWRMKKACFFCPWSVMRPLRLKSSWRPGLTRRAERKSIRSQGLVPRSCGILLSIAIWWL